MLRVLLLAAFALGVVAAPVSAGHCDVVPAHASGGHHDADGDDACQHCPPSECAREVGCTGASLILATVVGAGPGTVALEAALPVPEPMPWASRDGRPPTPPPVIRLT